MTTINVNFAEMVTAAEKLKLNAKALQDSMTRLETALKPLQATWLRPESASGEAVVQSTARVSQAVESTTTTLTEFARTVHDGASRQQAEELQRAGNISQAVGRR